MKIREKRKQKEMKQRAEHVWKHYVRQERLASMGKREGLDNPHCLVTIDEEDEVSYEAVRRPQILNGDTLSCSSSMSCDSVSQVYPVEHERAMDTVSFSELMSLRTACLQILERLDNDLALRESRDENSTLSLFHPGSMSPNFSHTLAVPGVKRQRSSTLSFSFENGRPQDSLAVPTPPRTRSSTISTSDLSDIPPPVSPRPLSTLSNWMDGSPSEDDGECEYVAIDSDYSMIDQRIRKKSPQSLKSIKSHNEPHSSDIEYCQRENSVESAKSINSNIDQKKDVLIDIEHESPVIECTEREQSRQSFKSINSNTDLH